MKVASPAVGRVIIAETEFLRVVYLDNGGRDLFVTFGNLQTKAAGDSFWGDRFFNGRGLSSLGLMPKGPTWFPAADTLAVLGQIRPVLAQYERIIGYGHSKGGYAALKYSAALGSRITIACAPQSSIAPQDVGHFDERYQAHYRPDLHDNMRITASDMAGRCIVAFDPLFPVDARHVALIERERPLYRLLLPMFGHDIMNGFVQGGSAGEVLDILCQDDDTAYLRARQLLRRRRFSQPHYVRRSSYLSNRRGLYEFSLAMSRRAVELMPRSGEYHLHLVRPLLNRGDVTGALRAFETGLALPDNSLAYKRMVEVCGQLLDRRLQLAPAC